MRDQWSYDRKTRRLHDENGLTVAENVGADDAKLILFARAKVCVVAIQRDHLQALQTAAMHYADDLESGLADGTYSDRADLDDVREALKATAYA